MMQRSYRYRERDKFDCRMLVVSARQRTNYYVMLGLPVRPAWMFIAPLPRAKSVLLRSRDYVQVFDIVSDFKGIESTGASVFLFLLFVTEYFYQLHGFF